MTTLDQQKGELLTLLQERAASHEIERFILKHPEAVHWHLNNYGQALHQVAYGWGDGDDLDRRLYLAQHFIDKGADLNTPSPYDVTPLEAAVYCCKYLMVDLLLRNGASSQSPRLQVYASSNEGMQDFLEMSAPQRAFFVACLPHVHEREETARQGLEAEIKKMEKVGYQLIELCQEGDVTGLEALISQYPSHVVNLPLREASATWGRPLLIYAAAAGQSEVVRYLVQQRGAFIHAEDQYGNTALQWAVIRKNKETARTLVDLGADPDPLFTRFYMNAYSSIASMAADGNSVAADIMAYASAKKLTEGMKIAVPQNKPLVLSYPRKK